MSYTNISFPNGTTYTTADADIKTVTYYDNYLWQTDNLYNFKASDAYHAQGNTKGMMTGSLIRNLETNAWYKFVNYYDYQGRSIQTFAQNHLGGIDRMDYQYRFNGEVLAMRIVHLGITEIYYYLYDHAGRKTKFLHSLNGKLKVIAKYDYDKIGRLKTKQYAPSDAIGSNQSGLWSQNGTWQGGSLPTLLDQVTINTGHTVIIPTGQTMQAGTLFNQGILQNFGVLQMGTLAGNNVGTLQTIDYNYHIRGGLRGINLDASGNLTNKLFSMRLDYENDGNYFDGNIRKQEWKSSIDNLTRSYTYSYDGASRILSGLYGGGKPNENYSLENMSYDGNGNITSLWRKGLTQNNTFGYVDKLSYSYPNNSNKIQAVTDNSNEIASFTDVAGSTDYTYYPDGSLKSDSNKGITLIEYNYLKLPKKIVKGTTTILYQYDASGKKLKETIGTNVTDYVGNLIYKNGVLYQLGYDEGRVIDGQYEYNIKDHLGNLRVAFKDSLGIATIVQSNAYGVWGEDLVTLSYLRPSWKGDNFKFTGKEDLTETGYTDFRARLYDKFVPRFITIDPMAEVVSGCSPYAYVYNAPTNLIDPDGMLAEDINKPKPKPKPSTLLPEVTVTAKRLPPPVYLPFISFPNGKEYTVSDDRMAGYSLFKQYNLLDEFANGLGPANRVFLADHPMTKDMQKASGIQKARAYFYKKYMKAWLANDIANSVTKGSVTNFSASFNPIMGPLRAGSSLTEQFVGNYRVDITSIDNGENLMFKVSDAKSNNSLYYHIQDLMGDYTPSFLQDKERVDGQVTPGGNTYQIYMWTERSTFYLDPPNK